MLFLLSIAFADCPDLAEAVARAGTSAKEARLEQATIHLQEAEAAFGCGWATPALVVDFWLAEAAWSEHSGDHGAALDSYAAARSVAADRFDDDYGTSLRAIWESAVPSEALGTLEVSPVPTGYDVRIDGAPAPTTVTLQSGLHLVQVGPSGAPRHAEIVYAPPDTVTHVRTGFAVEDDEITTTASPEPEPAPIGPRPMNERPSPDRPPRSRKSPALLAGGAVVAAAGAGLLTAAYVQQRSMSGADSLETLDAMRSRQLGFGYTGYGLVGLGIVGMGLHVAL